jgi:hypothetical protein
MRSMYVAAVSAPHKALADREPHSRANSKRQKLRWKPTLPPYRSSLADTHAPRDYQNLFAVTA